VDAKSSLGDAESSLGDAKSSLGDAKSSLGDVQTRDEHDTVNGHMRILGDHTMLYKYLNRNTLFIATAPPDYLAAGAEPHITVALVDTVSGRVLYRVRHQGAQAPVQVRAAAADFP
jgi:hypothetical protein